MLRGEDQVAVDGRDNSRGSASMRLVATWLADSAT
jgi:hypothetical protein